MHTPLPTHSPLYRVNALRDDKDAFVGVLVDVFFPACAGVSNKATAKNIPHAIAVIFTFVSMFNMY